MMGHNEMQVREFDAAVLPELSCDLRPISAAGVRFQDRLSAQNNGESGLGSRHRKPAVIHRLGSERRRVRGRAAS